jgi:hypothetical protein
MKLFILLSGFIAITCASPTINPTNIARDSAKTKCGIALTEQVVDSKNVRNVYTSVNENPLLGIFGVPKCYDLEGDVTWMSFKNEACGKCQVYL